jgi:hypothetical protein
MAFTSINRQANLNFVLDERELDTSSKITVTVTPKSRDDVFNIV